MSLEPTPQITQWARHRKVSASYVRSRTTHLVQELGKTYFVFSLIMRLPTSMLALSLLILMSTRTNEITLGGYGAGILMLSSAMMVPAYLKLADLTTNRLVLAITATCNIPAIAYLMMQTLQFSEVRQDESTFSYFLATFLVGITIPPFGALIRFRWSKFLTDTGNRQTFNAAIALESIMDVIAIPVGALLTGIICLFSPEWSVISVIIFDAIGLYIILWVPSLLERSPHRMLRPMVKPLKEAKSMRWVPLVGIACLGLILGSTESALASYTVATDSVNTIGFYMALLGFSGMTVGAFLLYYRVTFSSWRSWLVTGILLVMITMLLSTFTGLLGLTIMLVLLGSALGVALICMDSVATAITPYSTLGLALTAMQTTYLGGLALGLVWGVALGGRISYQASLLIPLIAAVGYFLFGQLYGYFWRQAFEEQLPPLESQAKL